MKQQYYASGKLLLTSEFMILHGAKALAIPLKPGQSLELTAKNNPGTLSWKALYREQAWFQAEIGLEDFKILTTDSMGKAENLVRMLRAILEIDPDFSAKIRSFDVVTRLEFNPEFGFGSSSTLTSLLAQWAGIDPMQLHFRISRGSGYDVACASADSAILYQVINDMPVTESVDFLPPFSDMISFVYLGQKQESNQSVAMFLKEYTPAQEDVDLFSGLTCELLKAREADEFGQVMMRHEQRLAEILQLPTLKESRFSDLDGYAKSLGAWGGDFAMLLSPWDKDTLNSYLLDRGYTSYFNYHEIVL